MTHFSCNRRPKELSRELDRRYFGKDHGKFKVAVSGCPNSCTKPLENDAGIMGAVRPHWNQANCSDCGICTDACPAGAIAPMAAGFIPGMPAGAFTAAPASGSAPRKHGKPGRKVFPVPGRNHGEKT